MEYKIIGDYEYIIKLLSVGDENDIQDLCERCFEFSELIEGSPPEKDAGRNILFSLPPNKGMEDKYVFGVYDENNILIAVIDMIKNYKVTGDWIIGLLMIDPNKRRNGLGRKMHDFIKCWVYEKGGIKLKLWVMEENNIGYKFWIDMGYVEMERLKKACGNKEHIAIGMEVIL